jgi:signal transduction histidine kinase
MIPAISPRQTYRLVGVLISALLLLLVAVPLVLNYWTASIIDDINQRTDPADRKASLIQAALSNEIYAILGFQATRDTKYQTLYSEQTRNIAQTMAELAQSTPQIGPEVEAAFKRMEAAINIWHGDVETNELLAAQLRRGEVRDLLFQHEFLLSAEQTATQFGEAVDAWRAEQRMGIRRITRVFTASSVVFAVLALVAIVIIMNTVHRLTETSAHLEARAKEEETLRQVGHTLTGAFSLDDVLRRITETASLAGRADSLYIELVNEEEDEITCVAGYGSGVPQTGTKGAYTGSLAQEVLASREPRIINDISVEKERRSVFGDLSRTCGNCAGMVVPLISENQALGALFLIRRHPKNFTDAELPQIKIIADMASLAIQRALTIEKIRKLQTDEHFLAEAAGILASSLDYTETLRSVVRLAVPRIADWTSVHLLESGEITTVEFAHADPAKIALAQQVQQKYSPRMGHGVSTDVVIRTGKPELYREITDDLLKRRAQDAEHLALLRELKLKSGMVVPLSAGREIFGAISFISSTRHYGPDDLAFAEAVARHIGLAIQNAKLYASSQAAIAARDQAIRVRDEVLRVVSHDLRNPVNNIQMTAKILSRTSLSEEKRESMTQIIIRGAERMNRLIDDLLAVARVREGQQIAIDVHPENPASLMQEACDASSLQARAKSIELRSEPARIIPTVKADRHRILQVLFNLLDNAIKFTPEGGTITVSCDLHDHQVRFAVKDTGRGIEREDLTRIFDLFWQAKRTAHMGSGFGLAIAKAIIEQHGGKIWVESTPGIGTTIFFTLPQAAPQENQQNEERAG